LGVLGFGEVGGEGRGRCFAGDEAAREGLAVLLELGEAGGELGEGGVVGGGGLVEEVGVAARVRRTTPASRTRHPLRWRGGGSDEGELDDVDGFGHVVEDDHAVVEGEVEVGEVAVVFGRSGEGELAGFGVADGVVAGVAAPAAEEAGGEEGGLDEVEVVGE
jgi:hypothetical protein